MGDSANEGDLKLYLKKYGQNEFVGYTNTTFSSKIKAFIR